VCCRPGRHRQCGPDPRPGNNGGDGVPWQQPHRTCDHAGSHAGPDHRQRVQVVLAALESPVQARPPAVLAGLQCADHLARLDPLADPDGGGDRLVGGADRAVVDDQHALPGEWSGERHGAGCRGMDGLADPTGQVRATVTGVPVLVGGIKPAHDDRRTAVRQRPTRCRRQHDLVGSRPVRTGDPAGRRAQRQRQEDRQEQSVRILHDSECGDPRCPWSDEMHTCGQLGPALWTVRVGGARCRRLNLRSAVRSSGLTSHSGFV